MWQKPKSQRRNEKLSSPIRLNPSGSLKPLGNLTSRRPGKRSIAPLRRSLRQNLLAQPRRKNGHKYLYMFQEAARLMLIINGAIVTGMAEASFALGPGDRGFEVVTAFCKRPYARAWNDCRRGGPRRSEQRVVRCAQA